MKEHKFGHPRGKTCRWTPQLDEVLLEGIEDNDQGRQLANERLKGLHPIPRGRDRHPRDFEKWLHKIFEKEPEYAVRPWLTLEFWRQEVDRALVEAIFSTTAPWPDRSGLAAAAAAGAEAGCAVWAAKTGKKEASAAKTIDWAGIASLF